MDNPAGRSKNDHPPGAAHWRKAIESLGKIPNVALVSVIGPVVLLVAGYLLWINYGAKHLNTKLYGVRAENIILTPQPTWIESPVLSEVFEGSELGRLSTLDRQMSAAVYNAFRSHPWIRRVFRVHKVAGAQVQVDVEYREPLAMVYCELPIDSDPRPSRLQNNLKKPVSATLEAPHKAGERSISFLPVDADGVLLPTKDFKPEQIPKFMLIYAQSATPTGMIGGEYGDSRIKEALLLCRLLKDVRQEMGIERVYVYPDAVSEGPSRWTLELTTRNKKIRWGHPPGLESAGEPGIPAKLRKLGEFLLNPKPDEIGLTEYDLVVSAKPTLGNALSPPP